MKNGLRVNTRLEMPIRDSVEAAAEILIFARTRVEGTSDRIGSGTGPNGHSSPRDNEQGKYCQ